MKYRYVKYGENIPGDAERYNDFTGKWELFWENGIARYEMKKIGRNPISIRRPIRKEDL